MEQKIKENLKRIAGQFGKAAIALSVVVGAQVVALEVVLRGWQRESAAAVFGGIGASAVLCVLAIIIYLSTRNKAA
jgi:hypothetical protein